MNKNINNNTNDTNTKSEKEIYSIMVAWLKHFLRNNSYVWKQEYSVAEHKDLIRSAISEVWSETTCPFKLGDILNKDKENLVKKYLTSMVRKQTKLYRSYQAFKAFVSNRIQKKKLLEIKKNKFSVSLFPTSKGTLMPGNMHDIYRQIKDQKDRWFSKRQIIMAHFRGRELERCPIVYNETMQSDISFGTRIRDVLQVEHCKTTQTDAKGQQMLFSAIGWFSYYKGIQLEEDDEILVEKEGLVNRIQILWSKYFKTDQMKRTTCFYRLKDFQDYLEKYLKDLNEADRKQALRDLRNELEAYYKHVRELIPQPEKVAA